MQWIGIVEESGVGPQLSVFHNGWNHVGRDVWVLHRPLQWKPNKNVSQPVLQRALREQRGVFAPRVWAA